MNIWTNDYNPFQKWKTLAWYDRMLNIKDGKFQAPVNIALDLIQGSSSNKSCGQFKCNFCMSDFEDSTKPARLPKELVLSLPKFFSEWGVKSLCIAGHHSDSTMYDHETLIRFLFLCKEYNIQVGFVTNGAYMTDELIKTCVDTCKWTGWSINAGTAETHKIITQTDTFDKIVNNIKKMYEYQCRSNSKHTMGYKYLITDDNYKEILEGVKLASQIGIRHFQLRPTELSLDRTAKIDIKSVEHQMHEALKYQKTGQFEVFSIREKFSTQFTKKTPKRCIASPLGSTWMADGSVVICPDRRWTSSKYNLGNFVEEGPESIKERWGSQEHYNMIESLNEDIHNCIRCTSFAWHEIYENVIENDNIDVTLI